MRNNLDDLFAVLTDPAVVGLPARRCRVLHQPSPDDFRDALVEAVAQAEDLLLIYIAGHGLLSDAELFLATRTSRREDPDYGSIPYRAVGRTLNRQSVRPQKRVMILDTCYSGRAAAPTMSDGDLAGLVEIDGFYVLTSSRGNQPSLAVSPNERNTVFTGELVEVLRKGAPSRSGTLTLPAVFDEIRRQLRRRSCEQEPQQLQSGTIAALEIAPNPAVVVVTEEPRPAPRARRYAWPGGCWPRPRRSDFAGTWSRPGWPRWRRRWVTAGRSTIFRRGHTSSAPGADTPGRRCSESWRRWRRRRTPIVSRWRRPHRRVFSTPYGKRPFRRCGRYRV